MAGEEQNTDLSFAKTAFALLFTVNLFNYIDRYILPAVFPLIQADLKISDTKLGLLASAFMLVYMLFAPLAGYAGDKWARPRLMAAASFVWSAATSLAGFAGSYPQLLLARSAVGIGEAGFVTVAQSYGAELFRPDRRARIMALFTLAIPAGSAIGYMLGGTIGAHYGWRAAFWVLGAPGALLALAVSLLPEPRMRLAASYAAPRGTEYSSLLKNRVFLACSFTQAAATFCVGGLSAWMPTYFVRYFNFDVAKASLVFGGMTVVSGIAGTWLGGWLGDYFLPRSRRSYYAVAAASLALAVPCALAGVFSADKKTALFFIFLAETFVFMHGGPMNAAIVKATAPNIRAMAFAANILIIHAFGDAVSPAVIGVISDAAGLRLAVAACALALGIGAACAAFGGICEKTQETASPDIARRGD
ncbi:MAG: MFS transporter [Elusimicrobiales bacterium]|nr:MFS transporter [Elusimicrobiales bacterium]